jgi:hypothetical protein
MSEIDEIMTAILNYGEGCWSRSDTDTAKTRQGLRDLISAVIADARRDAGGAVTICRRPCRCGPEGCADSVACPRHNRTDG